MITIPTLSQLYTSILSDIQSAYGSNIPTFGKNFLRVLAGVQAAKLKLYYLAIANLQKNIFIDTADPEAQGGTLERFGRIKLNRNPFAAVSAQYKIQVTGSTGATIKASQTFRSNDDSSSPGMLFVLDNAYSIVSSTDSIVVRALNSGLASQLQPGDGLTATSPIVNINSLAAVISAVVAPLDAENIEDYRTKGIQAYQLEPQGGAAADYRLWSLDAQGVKQTYPYAKTGFSNEINLFVEATIANSTDGKGTPSAAILTAVQAVVEFNPDTTKPLNQRGRRPLGVFWVHYLPIIPRQIDIVIPTFVNLTPTIQTAITNALTAMVNSIRPFVAAADILANKNDILDVNKITASILLAAPGSSFGAVILQVDGSSYATFTFQNGDIPYFHGVTFT